MNYIQIKIFAVTENCLVWQMHSYANTPHMNNYPHYVYISMYAGVCPQKTYFETTS
jgi:hypothetical protein